MSRPSWVPAGDWATLEAYAARYDSYPEVYAAIGWWETHWGQLGAGRQGYILGVGVPSSGAEQSQYQGLAAQLDWTAPRVQTVIDRHPDYAAFLQYAQSVQRPSAPVAWAKGVWAVYQGLGAPTVPGSGTPHAGTGGGSSGGLSAGWGVALIAASAAGLYLVIRGV